MSSIFFCQIINLYFYTCMNIFLWLKCKLQFLQMLNMFLFIPVHHIFPYLPTSLFYFRNHKLGLFLYTKSLHFINLYYYYSETVLTCCQCRRCVRGTHRCTGTDRRVVPHSSSTGEPGPPADDTSFSQMNQHGHTHSHTSDPTRTSVDKNSFISPQ